MGRQHKGPKRIYDKHSKVFDEWYSKDPVTGWFYFSSGVVYSKIETKVLTTLPDDEKRLIHRIKKLFGGRVTQNTAVFH